MIISVKLFAAAKQFAGTESVSIETAKPITVNELRDLLSSQHPELTPLLPSARIAVNTDYASADTLVSEDDEVAIIPPVSGG